MNGCGPSCEDDEAIVSPVVTSRSPKLGPVALMVSAKADLNDCRKRLHRRGDDFFPLYLSRLYYPKENRHGLSLVGPVLGAPYGAMVLESLIAWGSRQILYFGWCGSINGKVRVGDIIIPTEAVIDEGTSRHYLGNKVRRVRPAPALVEVVEKTFDDSGFDTHKGPIWTTDGVFRETKKKVLHHQKQGVLGVEMELSALLSVGAFRLADVAGVLIVSDELSTLTWRPGFKSSEFQKGRKTVLEGVLACCHGLPA